MIGVFVGVAKDYSMGGQGHHLLPPGSAFAPDGGLKLLPLPARIFNSAPPWTRKQKLPLFFHSVTRTHLNILHQKH